MFATYVNYTLWIYTLVYSVFLILTKHMLSNSVLWWPSGRHDKLISIDEENLNLWSLDVSKKSAQVRVHVVNMHFLVYAHTHTHTHACETHFHKNISQHLSSYHHVL